MINPNNGTERALERIRRTILWLAAMGTLALWAWRGWTWGVGFAIGAATSWASFRWIRAAADAIGHERPSRTRNAVLAGLRYPIIGAGAYVIFRFSTISVVALLAGLFVSAAAVILEIIFELVYARN
jgi:hypothetical protein